VSEFISHDNLHRTAKYFMDNGRVGSHDEAMDTLRSFGLSIELGPEAAISRDHQVALLTLVNTGRRTFLGGVHVTGTPDAPLLVPVADATTLKQAVRLLGGQLVDQPIPNWPVAMIGNGHRASNSFPSWRVTWDGWRGGVIPSRDEQHLPERPSAGLAPALAAAVCAAELFAFYAGDHPLAGRRATGMSLWNPSSEWLSIDDAEPPISFLPSRLWIVGLGNLGQAYLWLLTCLPYRDYGDVEVVLQDYDRIAPANESTSVLTSEPMVGRMKTRAIAEWLEARGFRTCLEERRFGKATRRAPHEPAVALCGVDNALARASLEEAGFGLVVETGLGAGPQAFRNFSLHTFPSSLSAAEIWGSGADTGTPDVRTMPAYRPSNYPGLDECGLTQLASRTVGVSFVGLTAASLALAELLRRLHNGRALEIASGSLAALEDTEFTETRRALYDFGHVPTATEAT